MLPSLWTLDFTIRTLKNAGHALIGSAFNHDVVVDGQRDQLLLAILQHRDLLLQFGQPWRTIRQR